MGAVAVGATIYYGSPESHHQIIETSKAFQRAHELGLATVLWCYLRNPAFKKDKDYHTSADLTGQANHLGVTIEADIIKQKQPTNNGGYLALEKFGKTHDLVYKQLTSDHPIDLTRYQVANCYMGRAGLINSGGEAGQDDFADAVRIAVINKRASGNGSGEVCVVVNDRLERPCLEVLADAGVNRVALRCAGFNNVDLTAARALGLPVTRVPAYSPHAVAEHAVGLLLALNRKIHRA